MRRKKKMRSKATSAEEDNAPYLNATIGDMKRKYSMPIAANEATKIILKWMQANNPNNLEATKANIDIIKVKQLQVCGEDYADWARNFAMKLRNAIAAGGTPAPEEKAGEVITDEPVKKEEPRTYYAGVGAEQPKRTNNYRMVGTGVQETGEYHIDGGYTGDLSGMKLGERRMKFKIPVVKESVRYSCVNNGKRYGPFMTEAEALDIAKKNLGDSQIFKHIQQRDPNTKQVYGSKDVLIRIYGTVYTDPVHHLGGERIISDVDLSKASTVSETAVSANRKNKKRKV